MSEDLIEAAVSFEPLDPRLDVGVLILMVLVVLLLLAVILTVVLLSKGQVLILNIPNIPPMKLN